MPDVTPPDLTQKWHSAGPPLDGTVRGQSTGVQCFDRYPPGDPRIHIDPPVVRAYEVSPGDVWGESNAILVQTEDAVSSYNSLKDYINDVKSWIFTVKTSDIPNHPMFVKNGNRGVPYSSQNPNPLPAWDSHPYVDPHPDWTEQYTMAMDNLLLRVSDAVVLAGQYADMLNNAAQLYVRADNESVLPELDVTAAPHVSSPPPLRRVVE